MFRNQVNIIGLLLYTVLLSSAIVVSLLVLKPFGIFTNKAENLGLMYDFTNQEAYSVVKNLKVAYFRPSEPIILDRWNNDCKQCTNAINNGFKLFLTIRNTVNSSGVSSSPTNIDDFKAKLTKVLEAYSPAYISIEDEENSLDYYSSSAEDYGIELRTACEVAKSKSIKCTNGGITGESLNYLILSKYIDDNKKDDGCSYAKKVFDLTFAAKACSIKVTQELPESILQKIYQAKRYLNIYKLSNIDYANFHWYYSDTTAYEYVINYLSYQTGKEIINGEIGIAEDNSTDLTNLLKKSKDLKLPVVIWISMDREKSRSFFEPSTLQLRTLGVTFRDYVNNS